ncbi:MAG: LamG-like jellyroll fold domain-containing protein [Methylomicrobium sp.]
MNTFITVVILRELCPRFFLPILALFLFSGHLLAGTVNLAWDPSTSSNVGGYKVSYGTSSGNYTSTIDAGNTTSYAVSGLQEGSLFYFAVKAYDSTMTTESAYSNEVNLTVPAISTSLTSDFTASKTGGDYPLVVSFNPLTTGTVTGYNWNFGDPSIPSSSSQYPTVTYANPGTYTVSLTVTGSSGSVTQTKSNFITVTVPPPGANFSATPTSGVAPVTVNFTDASTGSITGRSWNFGDGSTSTEVNPSHTYSAAGSYTVSLTVTGPGGSDTQTNSNFISASSSSVTTNQPANNNNGLVAAYGFEEVSGMTVADASGNGNHGTIKEAVRISAGRYGQALKFDGVNDWVTVNDSASLDLSAGMTLEAWVYPQSLAGWDNVVLKEISGGLSYSLYANSDADGASAYINNGSDRGVAEPAQLALNQWTHLVGTYDGQVQRLYKNGIKVAESVQSGLIQQSSGVLRIGGNSVWGEYFQGYIDEVRIYNRALTATEINANLATAISVSNPPQFVMGDKNLEPWIDYRAQGTAEAFQTTPTKSSIVTTVAVYLDAGSTATELVAGIYKNNNGHPGARVAVSGKMSKLQAGAWNSIPIPATSVTAGQPYWIAILGTKGKMAFLDQVGSSTGQMETSASKTLTNLPGTWTGSTTKANAAITLYGGGY